MSNPTVISVSQLNTYVKSILEGDSNLRVVYVLGEISNFTENAKSGHYYFSLKDDNSQIRAVMFRSSASRLKFSPVNGMQVLIRGRATVYERDGQFQLNVEDMQPNGIGALHIAFEQLKKKLYAKGFFDPSIKKEIPKYPEKIAVITSESGAAVRDIISVLNRRNPTAQIILCPVQVQGENAAGLIAKALFEVNSLRCADVIILARGGGSVEDLWAFNEETVAEAIHASKIPVISAVGHETDYTISDYTADLRAATPSVGAELCVMDHRELCASYASYFRYKKDELLNSINEKQTDLKKYANYRVLKSLGDLFDYKKSRINELGNMIKDRTELLVKKNKSELSALAAKLDALSPLRIISKGYALITKDNRVISSINRINKGDKISLRLSDGELECSVNSKIEMSESK